MPAKRQTPEYLKTHKLRGKELRFALKDEARGLIEKARKARSGRTAKTLVKEGRLRLILVALRSGSGMKKHSVDGPASVHVLLGAVDFHRGGHKTSAGPGSVVVYDAGVEHDVHARRDSAFLITMSYRGK